MDNKTLSKPLLSFPDNFVWGAGSSSYQMEGAWNEDGKGPSIWDKFVCQPGKIWEGHTGNVACDHYHRYPEDVALMAEIGLQAYRLSVSWPRILPEGVGGVNKAGLDFYDRLIDELLKNKIEPWVTLFHWEYPYALYLRGGWLNPDSPKWFEKYVAIVVDRLSDRVTKWVTISDPQCFIGVGYGSGHHAPGLQLCLAEQLLATHNCLLAHGRAVQTIRSKAKRKPLIGVCPAGINFFPVTEADEDIAAARQAAFDVYPDSLWNNSWWTDPIVFGHYPAQGLEVYGSAVPDYKATDFEIISTPIDYYAYSIFSGIPTKAGLDGKPVAVAFQPGHPDTHIHWKQAPETFYWGPKFLAERYKLPIYVMENGMSNSDAISIDGRVHDANRIDFMNNYLVQLRRTIRDGVDVRGYFAWTIMDNFEWQEGFKHRFGLIYVDYQTQRRTLKDSAYWYQGVIKLNGGSLQEMPRESAEELPHIIKQTLLYIHSHLDESFSVKDLANRLRCHPDYLSRKFKQHMGVDLSGFSKKIRLERARELLKNPKIRVAEAAEKFGFTDPVYFSKLFRRMTGKTPSQFKQEYLQTTLSVPVVPIKPENPRSVRS